MSSATLERRTDSTRLPGEVRSLFARLRLAIRAYAWVEGLSVAVVMIGLAFFAGWLFDWLVEPSPTARRVAVWIVGGVAAVVLARLAVIRSLRRLPSRGLAMLVERRFPGFADGLVTAVELHDRAEQGEEAAAMLDHTTRQAAHLSRTTSVSSLFNLRPLLLKASAAALLVAATAGSWLIAPDSFAFYLERLAGSTELWPRDTMLLVDDFFIEFAVVADDENAPEDLHVYKGHVRVRRPEDIDEDPDREGCGLSVGAGNALIIRPGAQIQRPLRVSGSASAEAPPYIEKGDPRELPFAVKLKGAREIVPTIDNSVLFAPPREAGHMATLRRTVDCLWDGDAREMTPGANLPRGRYQLIAGRAEILLSGGGVVTLQGPAEFSIGGSSRIALHSGALRARAPYRARPLAVLTNRHAYLAIAAHSAAFPPAIKVVRGGDVTITALADALHKLPEYVEATYTTVSGGGGREILRQEAAAIPGRDEFQRYTLELKNVLGSMTINLAGGDDQVPPFVVEAVDSPKLTSTAAHVAYPKYLVDEASGAFTPRTLAVAGPLALPEGSDVTLKAKVNKPLVRVDVTDERGSPPVSIRADTSAAESNANRIQTNDKGDCDFTYRLGTLDRSRTLFITLFDRDGVSNREPIPIQLVATPDEPPKLALKALGVGSTITPRALLRLSGEIGDEYGLDRAWFSVGVEGQPAVERPLARSLVGLRKATFAVPPWKTSTSQTQAAETHVVEALDLAELRLAENRPLAPGDQLIFSVKAADRCDRRPAPAVGESDRFALEVVSPEDFLVRLDAREVLLREKLTTIIDELEQTRDALGRSKAMPASTATEPRALTPQIDRAAQNSQRSVYETSSVANALEEIGEELAANRLDTAERRQRLASELIEPLRTTAAERYPRFDAALAKLRIRGLLLDRHALDAQALAGHTDQTTPAAKQLAQRIAASTAEIAELEKTEPLAAGVATAQKEADATIVALRAVLARLADAGDYNQIVEELRELAKRQEQIRLRTRKEQRRALLE